MQSCKARCATKFGSTTAAADAAQSRSCSHKGSRNQCTLLESRTQQTLSNAERRAAPRRSTGECRENESHNKTHKSNKTKDSRRTQGPGSCPCPCPYPYPCPGPGHGMACGPRKRKLRWRAFMRGAVAGVAKEAPQMPVDSWDDCIQYCGGRSEVARDHGTDANADVGNAILSTTANNGSK